MHISLDVWNTLVLPNKKFSRKRNELLAAKLGVGLECAGSVYTSAKSLLDYEAESYGVGLCTDAVYKRLAVGVACLLDVGTFWEIEKKLQGLQDEIQDLFLEYPPTIPEETLDVVKSAQRCGHTFSIASNNNFISGGTMWEVLIQHIDFEFATFSTDISTSKPAPLFWDYVEENLHSCDIKMDDCVHIGDNPICDSPGIMKHIIIEGPHQLAVTLKELVHGKTV